jgi:serine O-acetyltransferase
MGWLADYRCDVERIRAQSHGRSSLALILSQQSLWALLEYRVASGIYRSRLPKAVKKPLFIVCGLWRRVVEITTSMRLPKEAIIGPGLVIAGGGVILNRDAVLGSNCTIAQGVTIGESWGEGRVGVPVLGSGVWVGPNSVVAGKIAVGDGAMISALSLVLHDVPAGGFARGVPATIRVRRPDSEDSPLADARGED